MDAPTIEQLSEPSSLPEQIDAWLIALDAQGVKVDIEQRVRLNGLLLGLIAEKRFPCDPKILCRLMTPIVAGSPDQQTICETTFKSILAPKQKISTVDLPGDADATRDDRNQNWGLPSWSVRALVGGAIALTLLLGLYLALFHSPSGREDPPDPKPASSITMLAMNVDWIKNYPIDELQPPHQTPWNRSLRWYYTEYGAEKWIALLLPWLIWAGFLGFLYSHVIAFLRREALKQNLQTLDLRLGNVNAQFGDRQLIAGLQPLRTLPRTHLQIFDAERTAIASAEAAGLFQPRFKEVAVPTDFVILLDRRSARDHLAAYNAEVVRTLRNAGLAIEVLEFNRDLTLCLFTRIGEFVSLDGVVRRFPDSILLIFAAADQLVDPSYHQLLPAVNVLRDARHVVLLTPDDSAKSPLEDSLARRLGISIVRTTPAGLIELTSLLVPVRGSNSATRPVSDGRRYSVAALLAFFAQRPGRWMQTVAPPRADRLQLLEHLRRTLPPQILSWLTATAIYPELRWLLTLSLRRGVADPGQSGRTMDRNLLAISRLPWFRSGWMPDWVRTLLQQALSGREKHLVRRVILDALGLRDRRVKPSTEDMRINLDEDHVERREHLKTDGILLRYLLPLVQRSQRLFTLPESAVRKLMRKPLQRLAGVAAAAMLVAAATSFAALSLVPIDECDLLAASINDNARIGPGNAADMLSYPGYFERTLKACTKAVAREHERAVATGRPENGRFLYQLSRLDADYTVSFVQALQAAGMGYAAAYHSLGSYYHNGLGVQKNTDLTEQNYKRAVELGNVFSLGGLADVALERHDFQKAFDYLTAYVHAGGAQTLRLALFYKRSGEYKLPSVPRDMKKYVNLLELGVRRGDGNAANDLGVYWFDKGEYAKANELYELGVRWMRDKTAAANLAVNYMKGNVGSGRERDFGKATYFAIFGAQLGSDHATDTLYELISSNHAAFKVGYGPPASFDSVELAKLLATSGGAKEQVKLAKILEARGNLTEARFWYSKAAENGDTEAKDALKRLEVQ
jgi:TPR repeat protein